MAGFVNYDRSVDLKAVNALLPAAYTTAQNGIAVDCNMAGNKHAKSVTFVVSVGVVTDGTIDLTFFEDDNSSFTTETAITNVALASPRLFYSTGTSLSATSASDEKTVMVTVIPRERYVRLKTVETVPSAGYVMGAIAILEAD